jgi:hypothetical protein
VLIHRTLANTLTHARGDYDGRFCARSPRLRELIAIAASRALGASFKSPKAPVSSVFVRFFAKNRFPLFARHALSKVALANRRNLA